MLLLRFYRKVDNIYTYMYDIIFIKIIQLYRALVLKDVVYVNNLLF